MSQPITEVPMAVMPQNHGYPTVETMTTNNANEHVEDQENSAEQQKSTSMLR